jgi:hypothetical protein
VSSAAPLHFEHVCVFDIVQNLIRVELTVHIQCFAQFVRAVGVRSVQTTFFTYFHSHIL